MGDAAQVPTQWSLGAAAVALPGLRMKMKNTKRNEILALFDMAVLGLSLSGSKLHLIAVSWRSGRSRIVARVAGVQAILRRKHGRGSTGEKGRARKHDDEMAKGYAA
jgi:hypothetical protein